MFKIKQYIAVVMMTTASILLISGSGCKKDDASPTPAKKTSYNLKAQDVLGVTGTATFTETSNTEATITIALNGSPSGTHPAEVHMNSVIEGGAVVITLNPVDADGKSSTVVSSMTYAQLIAYDGFIQVHKSSNEEGVILAQGDIGGNVITTTNKTYSLDTISTLGVSGTVLFEKRLNGNTLLTITVSGTIAGESYPATINLGSIESVGGGPVVCTLNNFNGTTGKGFTNIRKLDSGLNITYDNWLVYDGYLNIYQTSININNIICHGNIGSN